MGHSSHGVLTCKLVALWVVPISLVGVRDSGDREVAAPTHSLLPKVRLGSARSAARVRSALIPQPQRSPRVMARRGARPSHRI